MKIVNHQASGLRIAYIGGGSREWAIKLMVDLALEEALSGTVLLYDIDQEAALENEKNRERPHGAAGFQRKVAVPNRRYP